MATSVGATFTDDPVLSGAFDALAAEGVDLETTGDLDEGASQSDPAAGAAAPPDSTPGADGSGTQSGQAPVTPDPAAPPADAVDPLAGTEPFAYELNGQKMPVEGIYRVPGEGLIVPEAHVASIEQVFQRAQGLEQAVTGLQARHAETERLSTWQVEGPPDAQGNPTYRPVTGNDGIIALRSDFARETSAGAVVLELLTTQGLNGYLHTAEDGRIVLSPAGTQYLRTQIENAQFKALEKTTQQVGQLARAPAPVPTAYTVEKITALAPQVIEQAIRTAKIDAKELTTEDRKWLAGQLPRYVPDKTKPAVEDAFTDLVKERLEWRKQLIAASRATTHNTNADKGRQPAKPIAKAPIAPKPADNGRRAKADWDGPLTAAMAELDIPR